MLILLHVQMLCIDMLLVMISTTVHLLSWKTPIHVARMYLRLRYLEYSSFDVDTLNEMSIQLRNLQRDFYPSRNLWSDG